MGSIGYARVSTLEQNADLQHSALSAAGCSRIFTDHGVSGTKASRPELDKLLDHLRKRRRGRGVEAGPAGTKHP